MIFINVCLFKKSVFIRFFQQPSPAFSGGRGQSASPHLMSAYQFLKHGIGLGEQSSAKCKVKMETKLSFIVKFNAYHCTATTRVPGYLFSSIFHALIWETHGGFASCFGKRETEDPSSIELCTFRGHLCHKAVLSQG